MSNLFGSKTPSNVQAASDIAGFLASPAGFMQTFGELAPFFRQQFLASGQGSNVRGQVSNLLSRRGLTGTGIGTALQSASIALPSIMALMHSFGATERQQALRVNTALGGGQLQGQFREQGLGTQALNAAAGVASAYFTGGFGGPGQQTPESFFTATAPGVGPSQPFSSQFPASGQGSNFGFNLPSNTATGVGAPGFSFGG